MDALVRCQGKKIATSGSFMHRGRPEKAKTEGGTEIGSTRLATFAYPTLRIWRSRGKALGIVKLPLKIREVPCQKTMILDFVVVFIENWPYIALLGQPFLNKTKAVTVTYPLMMKFPTESGVGVIKGSREMARRANLSVYRDRAKKEDQ
ncbi:hypothetical protein Dsin_032393 [Dipteronia sinensis]|uniref:Uncharacterized protein n=1 Tax=Dipteronia sinensis TaxID=43782 RepID=A0AAD9ZNH9_9ROSI|nr:hypothetical protein Dsin_032393 [Dipteronia sinensis]